MIFWVLASSGLKGHSYSLAKAKLSFSKASQRLELIIGFLPMAQQAYRIGPKSLSRPRRFWFDQGLRPLVFRLWLGPRDHDP